MELPPVLWQVVFSVNENQVLKYYIGGANALGWPFCTEVNFTQNADRINKTHKLNTLLLSLYALMNKRTP